MPIYMDLHAGMGKITAKDLAEAHRKDVLVQDQFGCKALTYWLDEPRSCVFCLIEGPHPEAVMKMHATAHGLVPNTIIPVSTELVQGFLGRVQDPDSFTFPDNSDLKVFSDPAFRVIMTARTTDEILLARKMGKQKAEDLLATQSEVIREQVQQFEGRQVELDTDYMVSSFVSATRAVQCALAIQKAVHVAAELIDLRIGLHAGQPVTETGGLFELTIRFAHFICSVGESSQLVMSSTVRNLYKEDTRMGISKRAQIHALHSADEHFLLKLVGTLAGTWQNAEADVPTLCKMMSMSKPQLYRRSKALTGQSPNELLREYRLSQSLALLKKGTSNISQTAFDTGFSSSSYFTRCFQERFGIQPLAYMKAAASLNRF